jgi:hypothetical protein
VSETIVFRQIILNYLTEKTKIDPSQQSTRQFYISQWCNDEPDTLEGQANKDYFISQWELPTNYQNSLVLTRDGAIKTARALASKRKLVQSFDTYLRSILNALGEGHANIRCKTIKALAAVIATDPTILGDVSILY